MNYYPPLLLAFGLAFRDPGYPEKPSLLVPIERVVEDSACEIVVRRIFILINAYAYSPTNSSFIFTKFFYYFIIINNIDAHVNMWKRIILGTSMQSDVIKSQLLIINFRGGIVEATTLLPLYIYYIAVALRFKFGDH